MRALICIELYWLLKVSYNLTGWLEKNKDPLNDTIVEMIKNGANSLLVRCFEDHPGQPAETVKRDDGGRKKKGGGKTVSSYFKGQLDDLMVTLYKTEPHFIRCVVPNTHKQPGGVESGLIMHQYQCNGVFSGIAICRKVKLSWRGVSRLKRISGLPQQSSLPRVQGEVQHSGSEGRSEGEE